MKKKLMVLSGFVLGLAPVVALAIDGPAAAAPITCASLSGELGGIICKINSLVSNVVPILVSLAVVYFIWGIISFIIADEEEAKTKGRDRIIYGIIGLTVIVAMWGVVGILSKTFGVDSTTKAPSLPTIPGQE